MFWIYLCRRIIIKVWRRITIKVWLCRAAGVNFSLISSAISSATSSSYELVRLVFFMLPERCHDWRVESQDETPDRYNPSQAKGRLDGSARTLSLDSANYPSPESGRNPSRSSDEEQKSRRKKSEQKQRQIQSIGSLACRILSSK